MSIIGFDASDVRQPLYSYTFLMLEVHEEHWYMPKVRIKKKNVKINYLGGFQNYLLGSIYQCKDCDFSEIWNGHNDNAKRDLLYVFLGVVGIGLVVAVAYFAFKA